MERPDAPYFTRSTGAGGEGRKNEDRPGGAANVALNIAALGGQTTLLGFVGQDEAADCLEAKLAGHKVNSDLVKVADLPTITKLRILSGNQQLIRLDFEDSFATADPAPLLANWMQHCRILMY